MIRALIWKFQNLLLLYQASLNRKSQGLTNTNCSPLTFTAKWELEPLRECDNFRWQCFRLKLGPSDPRSVRSVLINMPCLWFLHVGCVSFLGFFCGISMCHFVGDPHPDHVMFFSQFTKIFFLSAQRWEHGQEVNSALIMFQIWALSKCELKRLFS